MEPRYINELGIAIVAKDERLLSLAASSLSANCSSTEIRRIWKSVESELNSKDIVWVHTTLQDKNKLVELSTPLTLEEIAHKKMIEACFHEFLRSFVDRGNDLAYLRDNKLYRDEYPNWETYCQFKLGFSHRHARRLIEAAAVVNQLQGMAETSLEILPTSESIAREIGKVKVDLRPKVWDIVVDRSEAEAEPITANFVSQIVKDFKSVKSEEPLSLELNIGELVQVFKGRNKFWGEVKEVYSDGNYVVFDGIKNQIFAKSKVSKLDIDDYTTCHRINLLHKSGKQFISNLAASFHTIFNFHPWHLDIINTLEEQCNI